MNDFLNMVPEFLKESLDSLKKLEKALPIVVKKIESGNAEFLKKEDKLFRTIHSISGGSSFLGVDDVEKVSSWLEKLLFFIVEEKVPADEETASLVESVFKLIEDILENKGKAKKRATNKVEKRVDELFELVAEVVEEQAVTLDLDGKEFSFFVDPKEIEKKLKDNKLYILNIDPIADLDENKWTLIDFISELLEDGDILDSVIDIENVYEDSVPVSVLYLSRLSESKLRKSLSDLPQEKITLIDDLSAKKIFATGENAETEIEVNPEVGLVKAKDVEFEAFEKEENLEKQAEADKEFVSFLIGKEYYAVSIKDVFDMKEMLPCSRIPNQSDYMMGVTNLRGNVVPVVDMRLIMGKENVTYNEFSVFLIVKVNDKITGCVVDAIDDVVFLESEDTQITPATSRQINNDYVKFIAKDPKTGRFLIVLDLEKMLKNE